MTNKLFIKDDTSLYSTLEPVSKQQLISFAHELTIPDFVGNAYVSSSSDVKEFLSLALNNESYEQFGIIFVTNTNQVIAFETVSKGSLSSAYVHPRPIVKSVIRLNAAGVILAHNHPSGKCTPSECDKKLTRTLKEALSVIEVTVLDHVIVGGGNFYSFAENRLL